MPRIPPLALISSHVITATSLSGVSLFPIVPESEWRTPTLMVPAARDCAATSSKPARTANELRLPIVILLPPWEPCLAAICQQEASHGGTALARCAPLCGRFHLVRRESTISSI